MRIRVRSLSSSILNACKFTPSFSFLSMNIIGKKGGGEDVAVAIERRVGKQYDFSSERRTCRV